MLYQVCAGARVLPAARQKDNPRKKPGGCPEVRMTLRQTSCSTGKATGLSEGRGVVAQCLSGALYVAPGRGACPATPRDPPPAATLCDTSISHCMAAAHPPAVMATSASPDLYLLGNLDAAQRVEGQRVEGQGVPPVLTATWQ